MRREKIKANQEYKPLWKISPLPNCKVVRGASLRVDFAISWMSTTPPPLSQTNHKITKQDSIKLHQVKWHFARVRCGTGDWRISGSNWGWASWSSHNLWGGSLQWLSVYLSIYLSILIHDMKPEGLRLSCIHILFIPHAKLNQTHRKASSHESHLSWGYVVVVPNHRILQFCGKNTFFSLPSATFFSSLSRIAVVMVTLAKGDSGNEKWSQSAPQPPANHSLSVYQSIHIWFGHVMCARLITIPVVRRVVTTIFMAILLCSLMHVTLEKSFRNQAVTRVETWKPIQSLAYLSLSPINDLVSSEWVPVGFLMVVNNCDQLARLASCSNATGLFWAFWKRSTTPCFSGPARHFVVKDRKVHILNNLN